MRTRATDMKAHQQTHGGRDDGRRLLPDAILHEARARRSLPYTGRSTDSATSSIGSVGSTLPTWTAMGRRRRQGVSLPLGASCGISCAPRARACRQALTCLGLLPLLAHASAGSASDQCSSGGSTTRGVVLMQLYFG